MRVYSRQLYVSFASLVFASSCCFAHTDVTPESAHTMLADVAGLIVLDVREASEFCNDKHIAVAINMPWSSGVLGQRYQEFPKDAEILIVCKSGARSELAANFLDAQAYLHVYAMQSGMSAWLWEKVSCAPVAVADLACTGGTLSVELTWTESVAYDIIRIRRDGVQVAEVASGVRRFSEIFTAPGEHAYDVRGVATGYESDSAACTATAAERPFVRGDANNDATLNIADAIFVLGYLFAKGTPPLCADAANANADRRIDVADAVRILDRLFGARTPLPQPFPGCGNATEPGIGCDSSVCK